MTVPKAEGGRAFVWHAVNEESREIQLPQDEELKYNS